MNCSSYYSILKLDDVPYIGTSILDSSHLWEGSRPLPSCPGIGFQLATALNGSGIPYMRGGFGVFFFTVINYQD